MSEAIVHRVVGPPGCGKTTWLSRQCARAVDKYGMDAALVVSLTKAAAHEAASKAGGDDGLSSEMIGTLHSHCYRSIGKPPVAEDKKHIKAWNEEHPELAVLGDGQIDWGDAAPTTESHGDDLLSSMSLLRHRCIPRDRWPETVLEFATRWDDFKAQTDSVDFCDMIERARDSVPLPPGSPSVIFADEAQDFTRLELEVLEKWAAHVEHLTLVYDPAQSLYAWRGAAERLAHEDPTLVLSQSYRVPRAVQDRAMTIIRQSESYREAEYKPKDGEDGSVVEVPWRLKDSAAFVSELDDPFAGSTMVLAACSYMLNPLVTALRREGIPYHNPYSPERWNPLRVGRGDKQTTVDLVLAFCGMAEGAYPSIDTMRAMANALRVEHLAPGGRNYSSTLVGERDDGKLGLHAQRIFSRAFFDAAVDGNLDWFLEAMKTANRKAAEYPVAVAKRCGARQLRIAATARGPQPGVVIVGTVHSVKGGEADRVVVFPDLSKAGKRSHRTPGWLHRDSIYRMFYVAATRARRELLVGAPSRGGLHCQI